MKVYIAEQWEAQWLLQNVTFLKQVTEYINAVACCWHWGVRILEMAGRKGGRKLI